MKGEWRGGRMMEGVISSSIELNIVSQWPAGLTHFSYSSQSLAIRLWIQAKTTECKKQEWRTSRYFSNIALINSKYWKKFTKARVAKALQLNFYYTLKFAKIVAKNNFGLLTRFFLTLALAFGTVSQGCLMQALILTIWYWQVFVNQQHWPSQ